LGWVKKYLGQRQVSLLFTAGQKYAWVRSGTRFHLYPKELNHPAPLTSGEIQKHTILLGSARPLFHGVE